MKKITGILMVGIPFAFILWVCSEMIGFVNSVYVFGVGFTLTALAVFGARLLIH